MSMGSHLYWELRQHIKLISWLSSTRTVKGKLREELDRPKILGVLEKEDKPTQWVSSMAATQKPSGKARV